MCVIFFTFPRGKTKRGRFSFEIDERRKEKKGPVSVSVGTLSHCGYGDELGAAVICFRLHPRLVHKLHRTFSGGYAGGLANLKELKDIFPGFQKDTGNKQRHLCKQKKTLKKIRFEKKKNLNLFLNFTLRIYFKINSELFLLCVQS